MLQLLKDIFITSPLALLRGILFVPNVIIRRLIAFFGDRLPSTSFKGRGDRLYDIIFPPLRENGTFAGLLGRIRSRQLESGDLYYLNHRPPICSTDASRVLYGTKACHRFDQPSDLLLRFAVNHVYAFNAKELDTIARGLGSLDPALIQNNNAIGNVIQYLRDKKSEHDRALTAKIRQIDDINQTSSHDIYLSLTIDKQNLQNEMQLCQMAIDLLEKAATVFNIVPVGDFLGRYQGMRQPTLSVFNCYSLSPTDVVVRAEGHFETLLRYMDAGPNGEGIYYLRVKSPETSSLIRQYTDPKFVESEKTARRFFAHTCIHAMMRMPHLLEFSRAPYNLFNGTSDHSLTFAVNQLLKTRNEIMSKRRVGPQDAMRIMFDANRLTGIRQLFWYRPIDDAYLREAYQSVRDRMSVPAGAASVRTPQR